MLKETRKLILIFVEVLTGTMKFAYEENIMAKGEIKKNKKNNIILNIFQMNIYGSFENYRYNYFKTNWCNFSRLPHLSV
jgi:hypothetical protein